MPGIGPKIAPEDRQPSVVDRDAAATVAAGFYADGLRAGRAAADMEVAAGILGQNETVRARMSADQERAAYGPGGREHFGDPRPGDFPGRGRPRAEREAEAG